MSSIIDEESLSASILQANSQKQLEIERNQIISDNVKEAVGILSASGRYQLIIIIFFSLMFAEITFLLLSPTLFFMNPIFKCEGSTDSVPEDEACMRLDQCYLENDYTITAYAGLYCEPYKTTRNLIQSMVGFGTITGLLLINYLSDLKGRKLSFILSTFILVLSSLSLMIGAYAKSHFLLILSQFLSGMGCNCVMLLAYIISGRFLSDRMSTPSMMIYNTTWGVVQMTLYFFSEEFKEWYILLVVWMVVPLMGLFALSFIALIEDPVFYFHKKMYKECKESLQQVAMFNRSDDKLIKAFERIDFTIKERAKWDNQNQESGNQNAQNGAFAFLKPFKNRKIMLTILGLGLYGLGNNINYYALEYSIERTGSSFGFNVVILGIAEIAGCLLTIVVANRMKRKFGALLTGFLQAAAGMLFIFAFVQNSVLAQTILIFTIRLMGTFAYSFFAFLEVESFPLAIQSLSIGFVEFIGQTGKFIAPFMVRVSEDSSIDPMITMSLQIFVLCFLPMVLVKETFKKSEEETNSKQKDEKERFSINNV